MTFDEILYKEDGPIGTITINRPHDGNMFTPKMCHEIRDCINEIRRETRTRVIVLTGAGDRFFCIGGRKEGMEDTQLYAGVLPTLEMYESIDRLQKPVILVGDLNIGMDALDVWPGRRQSPGFGYSPEEQDWLGGLLGRGAAGAGAAAPLPPYVDIWRSAHPEAQVYSCFEQKTAAREGNRGSRIDYILVSGGDFFDACVAPARACASSRRALCAPTAEEGSAAAEAKALARLVSASASSSRAPGAEAAISAARKGAHA